MLTSIFKLKRILIILYLVSITSTLLSQTSFYGNAVIQSEGNVLLLKGSNGLLRIEILHPNIIRVCFSSDGLIKNKVQLAVIDTLVKKVNFKVLDNKKILEIVTSELNIRLDRETGAIKYYNKQQKQLLAESSENGRIMTPDVVGGESVYNVEQRFDFSTFEGLYGLGQHQQERINLNGQDILLLQNNQTDMVPFLISSNGYGILWNNYSKTWFRSTYKGAFESEVGDEIDYYFIYGSNTDSVISGYRQLTGVAPMLPKWAYGYINSKNRYKSGQELLNIAEKHRANSIPIDVMVLDYQYWGKYGWNAMRFDEEKYPDMKRTIDTLHHKYNVKLMISVWPNFGEMTDIYKDMQVKGFLDQEIMKNYSGSGNGSNLDAFNPGARALYWESINKNLFSLGCDAWWLDSTEPRFGVPSVIHTSNTRINIAGKKNFLGTWERYLNAYPLCITSAVYEGQRKTTSDKRVFILTRSAFAGSQRNAAVTWSGDIVAKWDVYRAQVNTGLNFCLSGIPYWCSDIGGYKLESYTNIGEKPVIQTYKELFLRWYQFGTFCPIFRVHGTDVNRELWNFRDGDSTYYNSLLHSDILRYRLLPYIYSMAWKVTHENYTMMRSLLFDFQSDEKVFNISDQFMFGNAIMVNPIMEPGIVAREVYLPKGADWADFWTGKHYKGGQSVKADAPLQHIPLFIRLGSIIPMGAPIQHSGEKQDTLTINVYPGNDGTFNLYEDEGDSYRYEKGAYSCIAFKWDNKKGILEIAKRQGIYDGMPMQRLFYVKIINETNDYNEDSGHHEGKKVIYTGTKLEVKLD